MKFVNKIHNIRGTCGLWDLSNSDVLILEGVGSEGLVTHIDKILRHGCYRHPLVNNLSCNPMIKDEFKELFSMLTENTGMNYWMRLSVNKMETKIKHTH